MRSDAIEASSSHKCQRLLGKEYLKKKGMFFVCKRDDNPTWLDSYGCPRSERTPIGCVYIGALGDHLSQMSPSLPTDTKRFVLDFFHCKIFRVGWAFIHSPLRLLPIFLDHLECLEVSIFTSVWPFESFREGYLRAIYPLWSLHKIEASSVWRYQALALHILSPHFKTKSYVHPKAPTTSTSRQV